MLFNSYSFIFLFVPVTVLGFMAANTWYSRRLALGWLIVCSMLFYGLWNPINLWIMLPSIAVNYAMAVWIRRQVDRAEPGERAATWLAALGVTLNLCFLGYFKYKNFFLDSVNQVFGTQWPLYSVILPLGISFITFQKIAFLLDIRSGTIRRFDLFDFLVFVFFFPQLIAGPIVHYREMMPQFERLDGRIHAQNLAVGGCLFAMGLFKKVVLADGIAVYASPVFAAAAQGQAVSFFPAWIGALAFIFQIYFDFSGYSDMALGLARIFGVRLPVNFNSPLKSSSIIEFWNRWHVTLTRFLTAYVYTPIVVGLTRSRMQKGKSVLGRRNPRFAAFAVLAAGPTFFTMLLSGLWHGAGVTFLAFGALHGVYLVINRAWRQWRPAWNKVAYERVMKPVGFIITFLAVVVAEVLFRANSISAAGHMLRGMAGFDGISMPMPILNRLGAFGEWLTWAGVSGDLTSGSQFVYAGVWLAILFLIATCLPNSLEVLREFEPALEFEPQAATANPAAPGAAATVNGGAMPQPLKIRWSRRWAIAMASLFVFGSLGLTRVSEFLYWQF